MKKAFLLLVSSALLVSLGSCAQQEVPMKENKGKPVEDTVTHYNNAEYNDTLFNGNSILSNQWDGFGVASPFILRHNGQYYLYCSTSNGSENGIRAWKGNDLVHWEPINATGLKKGYVVAPTVGETAKARAPEVYYYNGYFYMYESYNDGNGHFVLRSASPEGPFLPLSKNVVDGKKDGTVYFGKNENPYFFTAGKNSINLSTMQGMEAIIDTNLAVNGTEVEDKQYAESPTLFSRAGKHYLLYSAGYDKLSNYHISYATSNGWASETPSDVASSFVKQDDLLLFNSIKEEGAIGLGHPSTVLGPNLDSRYLVYDSLNNGTHSNHSLNIDRLYATGDELAISHNLYHSISPDRPDFEVENEEGFDRKNEYFLSPISSEDTFSVEYNFLSAENSELVFSYKDEQNYAYIKIDMGKSLVLGKKDNGKDEILKEVEFYNYFLNEDHHSVRLQYRDGKCDLYFENSLKINQFDASFNAGKIGYKKGEGLEIRYTCLSNVAGGLSDELDFKSSSASIPAALYNPKDSSLSEAQEDAVNLKHNDYVRYNIDVKHEGDYGVNFLLPSKLSGKKVMLEIDDGENVLLDIPQIETSEELARVKIGNFHIKEGLHNFKIQAYLSDFSFASFSFNENTDSNYQLSASLYDETQLGKLEFPSDARWSFSDGRILSFSNYRNAALTNERHLKDFDLSVGLELTGSDSIFSETSEAGILFRCNQYTSYEDYMDVHNDLTMWNNRYSALNGYYLAFTSRKVTLYSFDMISNRMRTVEQYQYSIGKKEHTVILRAKDDRFDLFVDNNFVHTFRDSLGSTDGAVGLYTTGAEVAYRNLNIKAK